MQIIIVNIFSWFLCEEYKKIQLMSWILNIWILWSNGRSLTGTKYHRWCGHMIITSNLIREMFESLIEEGTSRLTLWSHLIPEVQNILFESSETRLHLSHIGFESRDIGFESRDIGFESRDIGFESRDVRFESRDVRFESRDVSYQLTQFWEDFLLEWCICRHARDCYRILSEGSYDING